MIEDWRNALENKCFVSLALLHSYLRDRSQCVRIEDIIFDVVVLSKGVAQGSVSGLLLFNIFLQYLFYFINRADLSNYADDN